MSVAGNIMEKKLDQEHFKKTMSCDFSKLPKEKNDDSDDIMVCKNEAQGNEKEVDFVAKEMPNAKFVLNLTKLDN